MSKYQIGEKVIVSTSNPGAKTKRNQTMGEKVGTLVYVGRKFVVVDLGDYRDTFGYSEIRTV